MNIKRISCTLPPRFSYFSNHGFRLIIFLSVVAILFGCNRSRFPVAPKIESEQVVQGVHIADPYKWMENPNDPKTIAYLSAENDYSGHYFDDVAELKDKILKEFEDRDAFEISWGTNPILIGNYFYYSRITSGKDYPGHYRKLNTYNPKEESFLDENLLAKGSPAYHMNQLLASPDNSYYFYCYTLNGDDYRLMIHSFNDKVPADSIICPVTHAIWAQDFRSIVYVKNNKDVLTHKLNTPADQDILIYSEKRNDLNVDIHASGSGMYIFITSYNKESDECSFIPADLKIVKPKLIDPLKEGRKYFPNHFGSDFFLVLSDQDSGNRKLYKVSISNPSARDWHIVLEGNDSLYINDFTVIDQKYLLLFETVKLNARMRLIDLSLGGKDNQITFLEPDGHMEFNYYNRKEDRIVFSFASLLTPYTTYNYDMNNRELTIYRPPTVKGYQKEDYITELVWAKSEDGTLIPVSMIHKNGMKRSDSKNPVYLEAYGSYGAILHRDFNSYRLSLLDRGFYLAIAHVRGGGEFGKKWWEAGKLMNKKNAVNDYLACAGYLINNGYTVKGMITAAAGCEGGMVIGAAMNQRPDLFKSVLLFSPDMDMLSELLDSSVVNINPDKRMEFGNPEIRQQFDYLYSYTPYNNIKDQHYPAILIRSMTGDQQIKFSGQLKMIARLRATAPGKKIFLFRIDKNTRVHDNMGLKDNEFWAENWAFILKQYGIEE
jgi:oligopeptidase B